MTRHLYMAAGITCVALGVVGAALPIMPTVPFLLLALFCFSRSHPEWEERLLSHPHYGPSLRNWRERQVISRKAKIAAITGMSAGAAITAVTIGWPWVLISIAVLVFAGSWIWTRNE